jgi:glucose-6-phosphate isomerase
MSNSVPYVVSFGGARRPDVSPKLLGDAERVLGDVLASPLELLSIAGRKDDLADAARITRTAWENASEVFVLGTGGSSLGGQALADLLPFGGRRIPRLRFFDNPDPVRFEEALEAVDLKATRFLSISKSGGTAETLMQTFAAAEALRRAGAGNHLGQHYAVITETKPSPLRKFAEAIGCPIVEHPAGIGGRYSVLSVVGMLPAMLMGLDAAAVRAGAAQVLAACRSGGLGDASPAAGAALHFALTRDSGLRETVLWAYSDRLRTFGPWWRQLWAESLGKAGQGTTPIAALGPVDQHSQLQLFLDGPGGALFTFLVPESAGKGPLVSREEAQRFGVDYLGGRHMGDLVDAEARATAETLSRRGRPIRTMRLKQVDESAMGALFMHFMLETIVMGRLMGVDPFDQPAVEEGKVLARTALEGLGV